MEISVRMRMGIIRRRELILFNLEGELDYLVVPQVSLFAFSPDGVFVFVSDWGQSRILEAYSGNVVSNLEGAIPLAVAWSPDGRSIALSLVNNGGFSLFEMPSFRKIVSVKTPDPNAPVNLTFSPNGEFLAVGSHDKKVALYDAAMMVKLSEIDVGFYSTKPAFSPLTGSLLIGNLYTLTSYSVPTLTEKGHVRFPNAFSSLYVSPDGEKIAFNNDFNGFSVFFVSTQRLVTKRNENVRAVAWSPSSRVLFVEVRPSGKITGFDAETLRGTARVENLVTLPPGQD